MNSELTREQIIKWHTKAIKLDGESCNELMQLCTRALRDFDMEPKPLKEITTSVAVIERLDRDTDASYYIIVHKHPDGKWREAGAHISCGHFDDDETAQPLPHSQHQRTSDMTSAVNDLGATKAEDDKITGHNCPYCDFSGGTCGMDSRSKRDGTVSILRVGAAVFSNDRSGCPEALKFVRDK